MNTKDHAVSGNVSTERALDLALEAVEWIAQQRTGGMIQRKATEAFTAIKQARSAPYVASPRVQDKCFLCGERVESCASTVCPKATPPAAQPTTEESLAVAAPVQEPVAWMQSDEVHISLWKDDYHTIPLYTTPPAQPAPYVATPLVPDALTDQDPETPEYKEGWNDCRALMLNWRNNQ